jgi:hypothetical protein
VWNIKGNIIINYTIILHKHARTHAHTHKHKHTHTYTLLFPCYQCPHPPPHHSPTRVLPPIHLQKHFFQSCKVEPPSLVTVFHWWTDLIPHPTSVKRGTDFGAILVFWLHNTT